MPRKAGPTWQAACRKCKQDPEDWKQQWGRVRRLFRDEFVAQMYFDSAVQIYQVGLGSRDACCELIEKIQRLFPGDLPAFQFPCCSACDDGGFGVQAIIEHLDEFSGAPSLHEALGMLADRYRLPGHPKAPSLEQGVQIPGVGRVRGKVVVVEDTTGKISEQWHGKR